MVFFIASVGAAPVLAQTPDPLVWTTGLHGIAMTSGNASDVSRAEFARSVLQEMALSCLAEAALVREQVQSGRAGARLRWARAVEAYAARLQGMAVAITPLTPVSISLRAERELMLMVGGTPVMVSSLREEDQVDLEQRIAARFCEQHGCTAGESWEAGATAPRALSPPARIAPVWSIGGGSGPACDSGRGLVLQFADMTGMRSKRSFCKQLLTELDSLIAAIVAQRGSGVWVEWGRLRIDPVPDHRGHRVRLNGNGDSVRLPLPASAGSPRLIAQLTPWLSARVDSIRFHLVIVVDEYPRVGEGRP